MDKLEIKKCVLEILDSLYNRSGFDNWWDNIGEDIEEEIEAELVEIISRRLNQNKDE